MQIQPTAIKPRTHLSRNHTKVLRADLLQLLHTVAKSRPCDWQWARRPQSRRVRVEDERSKRGMKLAHELKPWKPPC